MFRIDSTPTFTADVRVSVPGADAPAVLTLTFRHKGAKALKAWIESAIEPKGTLLSRLINVIFRRQAATTGAERDAAFLGAVIDGWRDVETHAGAPVPYGPEALAQLLDAYPAAGGEIFNAYLAALTRGREKN